MSLFNSIAGPVIGGAVSGLFGADAARSESRAIRDAARANADAQREFAQMGIRWRVADAEAAGIHPLYAMGAPGANFTPSYIADTPRSDFKRSFGDMMGQNLSRAIAATQTAEERLADRLRLEHMGLQNDLLRAQITSINAPGNPPLPSSGSSNFVPGQGDSGIMVVNPSSRTASQAGREAQEAGWRPDVSYSRTDTGLVPVIPQGLSESMEDDMIGKLLWRVRNQVMPNFGQFSVPPKSQLPKGADGWRWDKFKQEWQPFYRKNRSFGREVYEKWRYGR